MLGMHAKGLNLSFIRSSAGKTYEKTGRLRWKCLEIAAGTFPASVERRKRILPDFLMNSVWFQTFTLRRDLLYDTLALASMKDLCINEETFEEFHVV